LGKKASILPFIKKKVEGFSLFFTKALGTRFLFSPIWNAGCRVFNTSPSRIASRGKSGENGSFPQHFSLRSLRQKAAPYLVFSQGLCYNGTQKNPLPSGSGSESFL